MKKFINIIDTSALMDNPLIDGPEYAGSLSIIPVCVLKELDNLKTSNNPTAASQARRAIAKLDSTIKFEGSRDDSIGSFSEPLSNGTPFALYGGYLQLPDFVAGSTDHNIVLCASHVQSLFKNTVRVLTNDRCLGLLAKSAGVDSSHVQPVDWALYKGYRTLHLNEAQLNSLQDKQFLEFPDEMFSHEIAVIEGDDKTVLKKTKRGLEVSLMPETVYGLKPKNLLQSYALSLLTNKSVKLVTLTGPAGGGKTLLALAAALDGLQKKAYGEVVISRPTVPLGRDIGFIPGTLEDKMTVWMDPIYDNLSVLTPNPRYLVDSLSIESLSFIRGRSFRKAFIIVDECQNLTKHEIKTIVSRVGDGSKLILLGDMDQIDTPGLDKYNNGLVHAINKMKPYDIFGHIELTNCVRSKLASIAGAVL